LSLSIVTECRHVKSTAGIVGGDLHAKKKLALGQEMGGPVAEKKRDPIAAGKNAARNLTANLNRKLRKGESKGR